LASLFTSSCSPSTEQGDTAVWNVSAVSKELEMVHEDAEAFAAVADLFTVTSSELSLYLLVIKVGRFKSSDRLK
jgi:hypothetical protein